MTIRNYILNGAKSITLISYNDRRLDNLTKIFIENLDSFEVSYDYDFRYKKINRDTRISGSIGSLKKTEYINGQTFNIKIGFFDGILLNNLDNKTFYRLEVNGIDLDGKQFKAIFYKTKLSTLNPNNKLFKFICYKDEREFKSDNLFNGFAKIAPDLLEYF